MNFFIPNSLHSKILDEIGKWSVIPSKVLFEQLNSKIRYTSFCKIIRKLEAGGLIKSELTNNRSKILYLTIEGGKVSNMSAPHSYSSVELRHDLFVGVVLRKLLNHPSLVKGEIFHGDSSLIPDAVVDAVNNDKKFKIAIELELTQKSLSRIKDKFNKYRLSKEFNNCLYIFNKPSAFNFYSKLLKKECEATQKRILLLQDNNLSSENYNFSTLQVWYLGGFRSFDSLFRKGTQNGQ
ncbi:MAG: hypothetical protein ACPGJV_12965 [Bacteriovoracaceae bacterium]